MGNTCKTDTNIDHQIIHFPNPLYPPTKSYQKCQSQSIRMGDIIRSKSSNTYQQNNYNFNLSVKQSYDPINIKCNIISNYSDYLALKVPVLGGLDTVRIDVRNTPIFDFSDLATNKNSQILHKLIIKSNTNSIATSNTTSSTTKNIESNYTIKLYKFTTYQDTSFKTGLYEAWLYNLLNEYHRSSTYLQDVFILDKGTPKSLVFVFNNYLYTLEDVLVYRKLANIFYSVQQQLYLAYQILTKYLVLYRNSILHRDIRPAKIYLSESTNPLFRGYEFQNLQSSRRITDRDQMLSHSNQNGSKDMLLTVRGVPLYCSNQVRQFHDSGEQLGSYDPWFNDRVGLGKTIAAIATLELDPSHQNMGVIKQKNPVLHDLLIKLNQNNQSLDELLRNLSTKITHKTNTALLDSDYNICTNYLPRLIKQSYKQKIEQVTTQILFDLHLREQFMHRLDKMMNENYRSGGMVENVGILDRIGRYYEGVGVQQNDYYVEEIGLLVDLAEEHRLRGFQTDNFVNQANQLYFDKFNGKCSNPIINSNLKVQNSYSFLQKNNIESALNQINKAMVEASSSKKIPVKQQIKLIEIKGIAESIVNGPEAGNVYFENGLRLCNMRQNFITEVEMLDNRSNFQYLLGKNIISKIHKSKGQISQEQLSKLCGQAQSLLTQAKNTKMEIPLKNPLPLAHIYESFGDLALIRDDYNGVNEFYDRAYRLMVGSEVEIANREKIRILEKIYEYYSKHSENFAEQERIKVYLNDLKKSEAKSSKEQDQRKYFKSIRYKKQQLKSKIQPQPQKTKPIQQVEQAFEQDQSKRIHQIGENVVYSNYIPMTG